MIPLRLSQTGVWRPPWNAKAIFAFGLFFLLRCQLTAQTSSLPAPASNTNFIAMIEGNVEVRHAEATNWVTARLNQTLQTGDRVRTGERSRAEIYLATGMTIQKGELSELEIPPGGKVAFRRGIFKIFDRSRDQQLEFGMPTATAAIRGTDFLVHVRDDGLSEVVVLDGSVLLKNSQGEVLLADNERGVAEAGKAPQKSAVIEAVNDLIQWNLYYPAVVDVDSLGFNPVEQEALASSLNNYRAGDLLRAADSYNWNRANLTDAETVYRAELLLSLGQVDEAKKRLENVESLPDAAALLTLIKAVKFEQTASGRTNTTAAEWLAESYYQQSLADLPAARRAAREATVLAPHFGFAWARLAELEFCFGHRQAAEAALRRALALSPRNAQAIALKGFLLVGEGRNEAAEGEFDKAIAVDSGLGNAWLGRGLTFIHAGRDADGLRDLIVAASLEPQRSVLRSYLGKAFALKWDDAHAAKELRLAAQLDPRDPTPWLYAALLEQSQNRINEAVGSLEESIELNDNRAVYRSQLLLDEDRAVRSANLASVYNDDGMTEISVDEASKAVVDDYGNYSAHLFLANSYNELRDPNLTNLRYETATFSEYLVANLLAPVGGTPLSSFVSQQDYSRLFAQEGPHFSSQTTYTSRGEWLQEATLYGWQGNTGYAVDTYYRSSDGDRINDGIDQWAVSAELKQQLTPNDSAYVEADFSHLDSGDVRQYYDQSSADPNLRVSDHQIPNLFLGYNHEWSPGMQTLLLAGRLEDNYSLSDANVTSIPGVVRGSSGNITNTVDGVFGGGAGTINDLQFRSTFEAYSVELQQVAQLGQHTLIGGARYQDGTTHTSTEEAKNAGFPPYFFPPSFTEDFGTQSASGDLRRWNIYGYDQWQMFDPFWLTGGLTYDQLHYPINVNAPPISSEERTTSRISPKAGFVWTPADGTTFRGAYTRSLGGLFYDGSVRLEPVQVAGFVQAYRSLIPDSVEGSIAGSKFQTFDLAWEQKFKSRTYVTLGLELLQSRASQDIGAFNFDVFTADVTPTQLPQNLKYQEESLTLSVNQIVGPDWEFGAHYEVSDADLRVDFPGQSPAVFPDTHDSALLHTLDLDAIFNHPSGLFAEGQVLWRGQSNFDDDSDLMGDNFWQFNLYGGYRFAHRRVELTAGLLNLTGQNYRLNPLNLYRELPRERTLEVSLTMNF